ncbi:hypothetical protein AAIH15_34915, partial [Pseudomonas aeruginosa]|uniref:hypothetical protein n=1 Tax=Pseudomonas aeruginosa TaxID=287 RepID=UPI0031B6A44D
QGDHRSPFFYARESLLSMVAFTSNALLISIPVTLRQREVGLNLLNTPKTICLIRKKGTDLFSLL